VGSGIDVVGSGAKGGNNGSTSLGCSALSTGAAFAFFFVFLEEGFLPLAEQRQAPHIPKQHMINAAPTNHCQIS
jgi:hypothetical protein